MSDKSTGWRKYRSPGLLAGKLRERGVVGSGRILLKYVRQGLDRPTKPVRVKLWGVIDNIRFNQLNVMKSRDVLYAFYDLEVSNVSFDIIDFLALAELQRRESGCSSLHVVIVPGSDEGFRPGNSSYDTEHKRWRLRNIVVPACGLIPACQGVTICTSRQEAQALMSSLAKRVFPKGYGARHPIRNSYSFKHVVAAKARGADIPSIQATPEARRHVSDWIQKNADGRKVITVTLREASFRPDRNSDLGAWGAFIRSLDRDVYFAVVVRDIETANQPLPPELNGAKPFSDAIWNVELRAAICELSYLNMFVNTGPGELCIMNRQTRYLLFKMRPWFPSDEAFQHSFRGKGIEPGSQFVTATPFQRVVWEDDTIEVISEAFRDMCERIERSVLSTRESGALSTT